MCVANEQSQALINEGAVWPDLLKAIDEYNYCMHTIKVGTPASP
jgi:hypothetical protein